MTTQCGPSHRDLETISNIEAAPIAQRHTRLLMEPHMNDNYAFCGGRIHVALLTKIVSVGVIPFYILILVFIIHFGSATTIMFTVIILGSITLTTIHGAFTGNQLCLIPIIFLQVIFFIYDLILLGIFSISLLQKETCASPVCRSHVADIMLSQKVSMAISIVLLCALPIIVWIVHVVYVDIIFIGELDRGLALARELNENVSYDDVTPKTNEL